MPRPFSNTKWGDPVDETRGFIRGRRVDRRRARPAGIGAVQSRQRHQARRLHSVRQCSFRRDNPNVPSDLEQMPNLLKFLQGNGAFLTNHWTPLISHTSVDIVTALTGVYGDKFGVPIRNNIGLFAPKGVATFPSSFRYCTHRLADGF